MIQMTNKDGALIFKEDGSMLILLPDWEDVVPFNAKIISSLSTLLNTDINFSKYVLEVGNAIIEGEDAYYYNKEDVIDLIEEVREDESVKATIDALQEITSSWKEYQALYFIRGGQ